MNNNTSQMDIEQLVSQSEQMIQSALLRIQEIAKTNEKRVLKAFWDNRVSEFDLHGTTGYGLNDEGRDKLERVYAQVFGCEAALVRPQIISGTHALKLALFGVLRPGDNLLFATGMPYDTLEAVAGIRQSQGSLAEWGVSHTVIPLSKSGDIDVAAVSKAVSPRTKVIMFQRSRGYAKRPALSVARLQAAFSELRLHFPHVIFFVDNCYGEFTETEEPTAAGADLAAGSLIKNPGGGIASTGGYIVGRQHLIDRVAAQLTAPGIGAEAGPTHGFLREFYQGLFLAPHTVGQALMGSVLAARVLDELGFSVDPKWDEPRSDLILAVEFGEPEYLLAFCEAVQSSAPVDSFVRPEPARMAGYEDKVIMAAGTFVQGGSLELSADGPLRPPFTGYFQGGLTYEHAYIAVSQIAQRIAERRI